MCHTYTNLINIPIKTLKTELRQKRWQVTKGILFFEGYIDEQGKFITCCFSSQSIKHCLRLSLMVCWWKSHLVGCSLCINNNLTYYKSGIYFLFLSFCLFLREVHTLDWNLVNQKYYWYPFNLNIKMLIIWWQKCWIHKEL